jgi:hypothetical protein
MPVQLFSMVLGAGLRHRVMAPVPIGFCALLFCVVVDDGEDVQQTAQGLTLSYDGQ